MPESHRFNAAPPSRMSGKTGAARSSERCFVRQIFIEVKYNGRHQGKTDASAPDGLRILMSLIRASLKGCGEWAFYRTIEDNLL